MSNSGSLDKLSGLIKKSPGILGYDEYKASSVLVALVKNKGTYSLLFEKRAAGIRQGGEMSFPGGRYDARYDNNFIDTALRETEEELNIHPDSIEIIGKLGAMVLPQKLIIEPVVGYIRDFDNVDVVPDKNEVEKTLIVPVKYFIDNPPKRYKTGIELQPYIRDKNGAITDRLPVEQLGLPKEYKDPWGKAIYEILVYEHPEEIIWGLTAKIVNEFVKTSGGFFNGADVNTTAG